MDKNDVITKLDNVLALYLDKDVGNELSTGFATIKEFYCDCLEAIDSIPQWQSKDLPDKNGLWFIIKKGDNKISVVLKKDNKLQIWDKIKGIRLFKDDFAKYIWIKADVPKVLEEGSND